MLLEMFTEFANKCFEETGALPWGLRLPPVIFDKLALEVHKVNAGLCNSLGHGDWPSRSSILLMTVGGSLLLQRVELVVMD